MERLESALIEVAPETKQLEFLGTIEEIRLSTNQRLIPKKRAELGQFMTPGPVARLMASMIGPVPEDVHILDAGAGVGSLTVAAVAELLRRKRIPRRISATAFEIDETMVAGLRESFSLCAQYCATVGVAFEGIIRTEDFLEHSAANAGTSLFSKSPEPLFDLAIQNPPYKKMHSTSKARSQARSLGIEATNLYTAFIAATLPLLKPQGQLISITPRSFCNGPYFKPFRERLLQTASIDRIHIFETRNEAFKDDNVLQETVILSCSIGNTKNDLIISSSADAESEIALRHVNLNDVVRLDDPQLFIHIRTDERDEKVASIVESLPSTLNELGLKVSTGRVVDFRAREHLRAGPNLKTVPLIYPGNLRDGKIEWPLDIRKPNSIERQDKTEAMLVPSGYYVLVKRFSSKEEKRRVVAAVYSPTQIATAYVGFENHLNYFHVNGNPLEKEIAHGLATFLNSTLVDTYFRQFNGHTQVNATDLRALKYPAIETLRNIGQAIHGTTGTQKVIDSIVEFLI